MLLEQNGEPSSTVNEGIRLEDNSESEPHGILLEDEKDFDDGKHILQMQHLSQHLQTQKKYLLLQ